MIERRPLVIVVDEAAAVLPAATRGSRAFSAVWSDVQTLLCQARRSRPRSIRSAGVVWPTTTQA